jgi:chromosome segregation ATPase
MENELLRQILDKLNALATDMRDVKTSIAKLDERMAKLEDRMVSLEDRLAKLEDRVAKLEDRMAKLEGRVTSLEVSMRDVKDFMEVTTGAMLKIEVDELPKIQFAIQIADESLQSLLAQRMQFEKLENRTEDHGNRIWALEEFVKRPQPQTV